MTDGHVEGGWTVPDPFDLDKKLLDAANAGGRLIASRWREAMPTKTGDARRSVQNLPARLEGDKVVIEIIAGGQGAPQARWIELGTGVNSIDPDSSKQPIVIRPVKAKALAWPGKAMGAPGGKFRRLSGSLRVSTRKAIAAGKIPLSGAGGALVFARQVVQQGLKPQLLGHKAIQASVGDVTKLMQDAWKKALGG